MDFIEKLLGIAPDGGNGMSEMSLVASVAAGTIVAVMLYVRRVRRLKEKRS